MIFQKDRNSLTCLELFRFSNDKNLDTEGISTHEQRILSQAMQD